METSKANHIQILYSNNREYTFLCIQIFDVKQQKMRRKKNNFLRGIKRQRKTDHKHILEIYR